MTKPVIEVRGLSKRYRLGRIGVVGFRHGFNQWFSRPHEEKIKVRDGVDFWALRDVSFEVQPGEVLGIIGRNGAGKSTLLKILSRITEPTAGEAILRGRVASLLEVGTGFHPELTGRENIYLNGTILGMKKREIDARFDEIVAFAEMEKFIDTPVKRYSSGQSVRLGFAVAAHLESEILIVDEVLAVGDYAFQRKCVEQIKTYGGGGKSVIVVSHVMPTVLRLCSRVIWLEEGRIRQQGVAPDVVQHYLLGSSGERSEKWVDLSGEQRSQGHGTIRFVQARVVSEGNKGSELMEGQPIGIEVEVEANRESEYFEVGATIKSPNDECLFTCSSLDRGDHFRITPGRHRFKLVLDPNLLKAGFYVVQLGITCERLEDCLANALRFELLPSKARAKNRIGELPGYLSVPHRWEKVR